MNLESIESPDFLKELTNEDCSELANDIRSFLIDSVQQTGGHLASNLGIVELSMMLLKVFDLPKDTIIYDVGHQCYTHKILTGRAKDFPTLRHLSGLSGFPKRSESIYDPYETGHSSTSISLAAGKAVSNQVKQTPGEVIAVIGDGALTGGMSFEALNYLGSTDLKVIVILNDNEFSISKNVGALSTVLQRIRISKSYQKMKSYIPKFIRTFANALDYSMAGINLFESLGFDYIGPVDGHSIEDLDHALHLAKSRKKSVLVHVKTTKGKGLKSAEENQEQYHGISYFKIEEKETGPSWSKGMADVIHEASPSNLTVITPAMVYGSGLMRFRDRNLIDVGIAEAHAATMASAIALDGSPVYLPLYSTFSQRAFDSFIHDISRMNAPLLIGIDRANLVPHDGDTHQGVFDVAMFSMMPNIILTMPRDLEEAKELVHYAWNQKQPFVIRYPKGTVPKAIPCEKITAPSWIKMKTGTDLTIISYGETLVRLEQIIEELDSSIELINARFLSPIDKDLFQTIKGNILVVEEVMNVGSLGATLKSIRPNVETIALEEVPSHGTIEELRIAHHLDDESLKKEIVKRCA